MVPRSAKPATLGGRSNTTEPTVFVRQFADEQHAHFLVDCVRACTIVFQGIRAHATMELHRPAQIALLTVLRIASRATLAGRSTPPKPSASVRVSMFARKTNYRGLSGYTS